MLATRILHSIPLFAAVVITVIAGPAKINLQPKYLYSKRNPEQAQVENLLSQGIITEFLNCRSPRSQRESLLCQQANPNPHSNPDVDPRKNPDDITTPNFRDQHCGIGCPLNCPYDNVCPCYQYCSVASCFGITPNGVCDTITIQKCSAYCTQFCNQIAVDIAPAAPACKHFKHGLPILPQTPNPGDRSMPQSESPTSPSSDLDPQIDAFNSGVQAPTVAAGHDTALLPEYPFDESGELSGVDRVR